jgi:hypothetical protein
VATLSDLVSKIADLTDIPKATIFAYGRFAREGGAISQKGRGKGGAKMTATDTANLLIALGGTSVTRDAAKTIELFRPMCGFVHFPASDVEPTFRKWLSTFVPSEKRSSRIECKFGTFFDWLISESISGSLYKLLLQIPLLVISDETHDFMMINHRDMTVETAVERGLLNPQIATKAQIGTELELTVSFDRSTPKVDVEIRRNWNGWENICEIEFGYVPPTSKYRSEIITYTKVSEQVIFRLGALLRNNVQGES